MEFCGGHTHAIARYGVADLLPPNIRMIHGPGCPVCVLPVGRVDMAIEIARRPGVILATYGDTLRVPASGRLSLLKAKAQGADIRMVYSTQDALRIAEENPDRTVVMFAIGFETTTPPTALAIKDAAARGLTNFLVFCNHVLTPSAIAHILESPEVRELGTVPIDGFVGPAHVSTIIGSRPYEFFAEEYQKPVVIAGFEPLDVMQAILMLVRQVNEGRCEVENEFTRAVTRDGETIRGRRLNEDTYTVQLIDSQERLRSLVNQAFTPRMVEQLEPRIREITRGLLEPALEAEQCQRLATEKSKRSSDEVSENLAELSRLASGDGKLMPQIVSCVEARCTLGEISDTLRAVWGEYQRPMS